MGCGLLGRGNTIPRPKMDKTPQIRHWCFTSYEDAWPAWIPDKMVYQVYQIEVCPDSGRFHIQGYVEFKRSVRLNSAKKLIKLPTAHLEPRQGSRQQARNYCMKEESRSLNDDAGPYEYGEWTEGETKRSELHDCIVGIQEGKAWKDLVIENPSCAIRYYRNLHQVWTTFNQVSRDGSQPVYNVYIYGDARVGKTRFSNWLGRRQGFIPYTGYITGWWQDYMGQAWAIYDDFDGQPHMDVSNFKKICDRYPVTVPVKVGSAQYSASVNIFTSNIPPIDWYAREHWDAVRMRASHLIWWRSSSIVCESCGPDVVCDILDAIHEAQVEWQHEL